MTLLSGLSRRRAHAAIQFHHQILKLSRAGRLEQQVACASRYPVHRYRLFCSGRGGTCSRIANKVELAAAQRRAERGEAEAAQVDDFSETSVSQKSCESCAQVDAASRAVVRDAARQASHLSE